MRVPKSGPSQINSVWPDKLNAPVLLTSWTWRPTSAEITISLATGSHDATAHLVTVWLWIPQLEAAVRRLGDQTS